MRFRDDIDLATTWVYSDTHFGHDNIVGFCHRPEDHEQIMIAEWRKVALPGRTMLHLGDLCYRSNARFKAITSKELTGPGMADRNLLIKGNHDGQRFSFYRDCGFKLARPFSLALKVEHDGLFWVDNDTYDYIVSFSHYAWNDDEDGGPMPDNHWRVHGHIHNNGYQRTEFVPFLRNHINISVEQTGFKPVNLKMLLDAAILGRLPADGEVEAAATEAARERSLARRANGR
jgi:calcineurin-like phosphoesterase family protein